MKGKPPVVIREMNETDGARIALLCAESPDSGAVSFYPRFMVDPLEAIEAFYESATGVVAYDTAADQLIGMGVIDFGNFQVNGDMVPYGHISLLRIHPAYRRLGIATGIAGWLYDYGKKEVGADGYIIASIQRKNRLSASTLHPFLPERIGTYRGGLMHTTGRKLPSGEFRVREAGGSEFLHLTERCNAFYKEYDLFPAASPSSWARLTADGPAGSLWKCLAVEDRQGNIVAGAMVLEEYKARIFHLCKTPIIISVADALFHLFPRDNMLRQLWIYILWHEPGNEDAARHLLEWTRHKWHGKADAVLFTHDTRNPIKRILPIPFWHPQPYFSIYTDRALPGTEKRLIFPPM